MKRYSVRDAFLFAALLCIVIPNGWVTPQQGNDEPSVADLLAKLHSRHWSDRSDALDEIHSDEVALHSRRVQAALIDLLDQENQGKDTGGEEGGGEEFAEYFASLRGVVNSFADWNDPRQACILVYAGSDDYPPSAQQATAHARAAIPCLLKRSKSEVAIDRAIAGPMLVEAVQKARGTLDATTALSARQIILRDLQDPDAGVRSLTVDALGKFGGMDMVPALKEVAANDSSPEVDGHSIRKSAAEAIKQIQKREPQR
jgi:HEAT repeat protein